MRRPLPSILCCDRHGCSTSFGTKTLTTIVYTLVLCLVLGACIPMDAGGGIELSQKGQYSIKSPTLMKVSALDDEKGSLALKAYKIGKKEAFYMDFLGGDSLRIRAYNGNYVELDSVSGYLHASGREVQHAAVFRWNKGLDQWDDLKMIDGSSLCMDAQGMLSNNCPVNHYVVRVKIVEKPATKILELPLRNLVWMYVGFLLLLMGLISFSDHNPKYLPLLFLFLGALSLRYFVAMLPPYLHMWDEQFHALVARNMMTMPWMPLLYPEAIIEYPIEIWDMATIWLHKQPLFTWQMAISYKLFGVNTFATRLPSMLMSSAVCLIIYRIGSITLNKRTGYYGGVLFACSFFAIELVSGQFSTDHNDVAFLFYISASIWSWMEYSRSFGIRRWLFLVAVGIFTGGAMLVKWLTGILVFSGWGLSVLLSKSARSQWRNYRDMGLALLVALLLFLPWQLYILQAFPEVSRFELAYNSAHFFETIERHEGDFWFHFNLSNMHYRLPFWVIALCLGVLILRMRSFVHRTAILTYVLLIYLFFSLAATKMISFMTVVSFLIFLAMGAVLDALYTAVKKKILQPVVWKATRIGIGALVFVLAYYQLNLRDIQSNHLGWIGDDSSHLDLRQQNMELFKTLDKVLPTNGKTILFNCWDHDNIPSMLYSNVYATYCLIPEKELVEELKQRGFHVVVFDDGNLPSYITDDGDIQLISGYMRW